MIPDFIALILALCTIAVVAFGAWVLIVMVLLGGLIFALFDQIKTKVL